jgi:23S rRNA pseudouridine2605 synthase/23S rRNA pseudouridine2604 synthase
MRLQKYLSAAGFCSRRSGEEHIRRGAVTVNDQTVTALGTKVDPERDTVAVDGQPVALKEKTVYILLNKPVGYVTSCQHPGERVVLDLVSVAQRVFPVGRLDKDSRGLLFLTNDGRIHHRLSHPSFDHEKEYEVTVAAPIPDGALLKMAQGMPLMGTRTRPAAIRRLTARRFRIVLQEGRNRQIRRMVGKVGHKVIDLKRTRLANLRLGRLAEGTWRHLSPGEVSALLSRTLPAKDPGAPSAKPPSKTAVGLNPGRQWRSK